MKKVFATMMMVCGIVAFVSAQTEDDFKASQKRYEKLTKMLSKDPGTCGLNSVDGLATSTTATALATSALTPQLEGLYYRQVGTTKDGVTDVNIKKPTKEECVTLSATIAVQALAIKAATEQIKAASEEVKTAPMAQKAKAGKSLNYSKDVLGILAEESAFQTKAIAAMIETAATSENL